MKAPLDHLRSSKKSTYKRVRICLDSKYQDEYDRIKAEVSQLEMRSRLKDNAEDKRELTQLRSELEDAESALKENSALFHVRSLGPKNYDRLKSEYPATPDQRREAKKQGNLLTWDPEVFPFVLIQRCVSLVWEDENGEHLEPLDDDFMDDLKEGDQWSSGDLAALSNACFEVNLGIRDIAALGNA